jgi:hypothetical protein
LPGVPDDEDDQAESFSATYQGGLETIRGLPSRLYPQFPDLVG